MYNRIITLVVLIAAVNSFPSGVNEEGEIGQDVSLQQSYDEMLVAPEPELQQDDEGYRRPGGFRIRNSRSKSFIPQLADRGNCPTGPSLPIRCDPKRPWPACPPQSYCYATNSVDLGNYFCCAV